MPEVSGASEPTYGVIDALMQVGRTVGSSALFETIVVHRNKPCVEVTIDASGALIGQRNLPVGDRVQLPKVTRTGKRHLTVARPGPDAAPYVVRGYHDTKHATYLDELHRAWEAGVPVGAVLRFLASHAGEIDAPEKSTVVVRVDGFPDWWTSPAGVAYQQQQYGSHAGGSDRPCAFCGSRPIARITPKALRWGSAPMSFNQPAWQGYGWRGKQGDNAPICMECAACFVGGLDALADHRSGFKTLAVAWYPSDVTAPAIFDDLDAICEGTADSDIVIPSGGILTVSRLESRLRMRHYAPVDGPEATARARAWGRAFGRKVYAVACAICPRGNPSPPALFDRYVEEIYLHLATGRPILPRTLHAVRHLRLREHGQSPYVDGVRDQMLRYCGANPLTPEIPVSVTPDSRGHTDAQADVRSTPDTPPWAEVINTYVQGDEPDLLGAVAYLCGSVLARVVEIQYARRVQRRADSRIQRISRGPASAVLPKLERDGWWPARPARSGRPAYPRRPDATVSEMRTAAYGLLRLDPNLHEVPFGSGGQTAFFRGYYDQRSRDFAESARRKAERDANSAN